MLFRSDLAVVRLRLGVDVRVRRDVLAGRSEVEVGVRPEKLVIGEPGAAAAGGNAIEGVIADAAYIGVSTVYRVELADGHLVTAYQQNRAPADGDGGREPGDRVSLQWAPPDTFAVDPAPAGHAAAVDPDTGAPIE